MQHKAFRGLQLALGLLLFAAGGGQPAGLGLVVQQIEMIGARQWLGLMAGSAMAPVSGRSGWDLVNRPSPAPPRSPNQAATTARRCRVTRAGKPASCGGARARAVSSRRRCRGATSSRCGGVRGLAADGIGVVAG